MRDPREKMFAARTLITNALHQKDVWYVAESANWAIRNVGEQIVRSVPNISSELTVSPFGIRNSIIHFGSLPTMFTNRGLRTPHKSNKSLASIFHLASSKHFKKAAQAASTLEIIHTSNSEAAKQLISLRIPKEKIKIIPLGVDIKQFSPPVRDEKETIREALGIDPNAFVIGSFQKDGVGWASGNIPKLEKGPDIFVKVLSKIRDQAPIHVLLVGPARGYVEANLAKQGIPYTSMGMVPNHSDLPKFYKALDLYLITSRFEGGPLALGEAWASGVPIIATNVGMIKDLGINGDNILIAESEDVTTLAEHIKTLMHDSTLAQQLKTEGYQNVKQLVWSRIAEQYYELMYKPLLREL